MLQTLKRIMGWCKDYKKRLYIGCVYSFFNAIFTALPIITASYGLALILEDVNGERAFDTKWALYMLLFIILAIIGRVFTAYRKAVLQESIGNERAAEQRIHVGDILKRVSLGFFSKTTTGDLMAAITTDLSFVELNATKMVDMVLNGYISAAAMILCLVFYNGWIALICIAGVLVSALFLKFLVKKNCANAPVFQKSQNELVGTTIEYIRGIPVVKAFKQEGASIEGIRNAYRDNKDIYIKLEKDYIPFNCLHLFALKLASVGIVLAASYFVLKGSMELPAMLMLSIFSFAIFGHVEAVSGAEHMLNIMDSTLDKLGEIENAKFIDTDGRDVRLDHFDICFQDVSFAYEQKPVLQNISFTIPENTTTAIVGPSGSGKTTICNLIARFYDVNEGLVSVGGVNVKEMTCDSLLRNISMVFQNVYLFNDTILNNVKFGKPDATMDEVVDACKKACCHDFIMELEQGYDTLVGEAGATLSGGEKQRISVARAMLKNASIIILDEATASVDPENEHLIQQAISSLVHGKTMIIIAHRLATIENADQILVVDSGRVVQKGTHTELSEQDGIYRSFISIREQAEGWSV